MACTKRADCTSRSGSTGIGSSARVSLGVTAASAAPGGSAASNVAVLSFVALLGFLVGPLTIGPLADAFGIRAALMVLAPMIGISLLLAPCLTRSEATRANRPAASSGTAARGEAL